MFLVAVGVRSMGAILETVALDRHTLCHVRGGRLQRARRLEWPAAKHRVSTINGSYLPTLHQLRGRWLTEVTPLWVVA